LINQGPSKKRPSSAAGNPQKISRKKGDNTVYEFSTPSFEIAGRAIVPLLESKQYTVSDDMNEVDQNGAHLLEVLKSRPQVEKWKYRENSILHQYLLNNVNNPSKRILL
jgi:hypothetical protein